jgi:hypothetical protein
VGIVERAVTTPRRHEVLQPVLWRASGAYVVVVPSLVAVEAEPGLHVMASLTEITPELLGEWSHVWAPR